MARKSVFRPAVPGNGGKPQGGAWAALDAWRRDLTARLAVAETAPKANPSKATKGETA